MSIDTSDERLYDLILARSLIYTRKALPILGISNDFSSNMVGQASDVIRIERPIERNSYDISPSVTDPTVTQVPRQYIEMPVRTWKGSGFTMTDSDKNKIFMSEQFLPMTIQSSLDALIEDVGTHVASQYKYFYGVVGTAGTTPFASTRDAAVDCGTKLTEQRVSKMNRYLILNTAAENNALKLPEFVNANIVGDATAIREGNIDQRLGFTWLVDQTLPDHVNGGATGVLVNGAFLAGVKSISIDTGAGAIGVGDVFTIAGHDQTYVCTKYVADSSAATLEFEPALKTNVADNSAITFIGDHAVNLAVHRMALAHAFVEFEPSMAPNAVTSSMRDSETGIAIRLEVKRQNKQDFFELDIKYGAAVTAPHLGVRLLG